jgi:peptide/nickel transport system permease protein
MRFRGIPRASWLGLAMTAVVVVAALLAPQVAPHAYDDQDLGRALLPPFWMGQADPAFPLGTDYLGRDLLSRLIYAARTSLLVGVAAVTVAGIVGLPVGLLAGFMGGGIDATIMRLVDMQLAFPPIVLAIGILTTTGTSLGGIVLVLGVIGWVQYARVIRGQAISLREREFVLAACALGAGVPRILWRHILPNALGPILVIAALNVSTMILAEASLSFLGIGVRPPTPAWGTMLSEGRDVFRIAWWNAVFPGIAIAWTVFGINLLGEAWHGVEPGGRSSG